MQAVILAAGRGTRMGDVTDLTPKPMLRLNGTPIVERQIQNLPEEVNEVIFVVGYLGDTIRAHFGDVFGGRRVSYIEQDVLDGTGGALWRTRELLHDRFLVLNGDDLYPSESIKQCLAFEWALLGQYVDELGSAGKVELDEHGNVADIIEKERHGGGPGYMNTNFFLLDTRVFDYELVRRLGSDEFGLPQTVIQAARDIPIHFVETEWVIRLTEPSDIPKAEEILARTV